MATSSAAYHASTPDELQKSAIEHDEAYSEWLAQALEAALPGVYRYEVSQEEW